MIKKRYVLDRTDTKDALRAEVDALAENWCQSNYSYLLIERETLEEWDYEQRKAIIEYPEIEKLMDKEGIDEFILLFWW